MRSHLRTPLIVDVDKGPLEYINGLNKSAKKNYKKAMRHKLVMRRIPYDSCQVSDFMQFWSTKIGNCWAFGPEYFDVLDTSDNLICFAAYEDQELVAHLPMEHFGDFMYAQPVMYDKDVVPYAAKFLWFEMLKWACRREEIKVVDMGGGFNGLWPEFIVNRDRAPTFAYKWRFVSKEVKDNPDKEKPWLVQRCGCGWKGLTLAPKACPNCGDVPCRMYG